MDQQAPPEHVQEPTHMSKSQLNMSQKPTYLDVCDQQLADDLLALLLISSRVAGSSRLVQLAVCCCDGGIHLAARRNSSTA